MHVETKNRATYFNRLRVDSNFGDSGEKHACARKWASARRRATRGGAENPIFARACISPEPRKLETTRSLPILRSYKVQESFPAPTRLHVIERQDPGPGCSKAG